jgi:hypothetical protein
MFTQVNEAGDNEYFAASSGQELPHDRLTQSFVLKLYAGKLGCSITTDLGTRTIIEQSIFPARSTQYIDCEWDSGTHQLRLYRMSPGHRSLPAATASLPGNYFKPTMHENFTVPFAVGKYPEADPLGGNTGIPMGLSIDSIRVSFVARNKGLVTAPNAELSVDKYTSVLVNASDATLGKNHVDSFGCCQLSHGSGGLGYLIARRTDQGVLMPNVWLHGIGINQVHAGNGIWGTNLVNSRIENNTIIGAHGINLSNVNFENWIADNYITASSGTLGGGNGEGFCSGYTGGSNSINWTTHNFCQMSVPHCWVLSSDDVHLEHNTCSTGNCKMPDGSTPDVGGTCEEDLELLGANDRFGAVFVEDEKDDAEGNAAVNGMKLGAIPQATIVGGSVAENGNQRHPEQYPVIIDAGGAITFLGVEYNCATVSSPPPVDIHIANGIKPRSLYVVNGWNNGCSSIVTDMKGDADHRLSLVP